MVKARAGENAVLGFARLGRNGRWCRVRAWLTFWSCCCMFLVYFPAQTIGAESKEIEESQLRAAIIVGILRYTRWVDPVGDNINVCALGESDSTAYLKRVSSRPIIHGKAINVIDIPAPVDGKADQSLCQVLLVGEEVSVSNAQIEMFKESLVICNGCELAPELSTIRIKKSNDRIVFEVNLDVAKKNGLVFRSALLELAAQVEGAYE